MSPVVDITASRPGASGERVYRLLGCDLTYHRALPKPGETLCYEIHVDGEVAGFTGRPK